MGDEWQVEMLWRRAPAHKNLGRHVEMPALR